VATRISSSCGVDDNNPERILAKKKWQMGRGGRRKFHPRKRLVCSRPVIGSNGEPTLPHPLPPHPFGQPPERYQRGTCKGIVCGTQRCKKSFLHRYFLAGAGNKKKKPTRAPHTILPPPSLSPFPSAASLASQVKDARLDFILPIAGGSVHGCGAGLRSHL
jgi:hypothetical protein